MENYKTTVKPSGNLVTTKLDSDRLIKDFPNIVAKVRQAMAIPNQAAYLSMMDAYDKIKRTKFFKGGSQEGTQPCSRSLPQIRTGTALRHMEQQGLLRPCTANIRRGRQGVQAGHKR